MKARAHSLTCRTPHLQAPPTPVPWHVKCRPLQLGQQAVLAEAADPPVVFLLSPHLVVWQF